MALLKDTLIQGSARVTDTLYANLIEAATSNYNILNLSADPSNAASTTAGLNFINNSGTIYAHIGSNNGTIAGIYSTSGLAFRPGNGSINSTEGMTLSTSSLSPKDATIALGGSNNRWNGLYLSAAVNFANNTWNIMGDDAKIGDINKGGHIGIISNNSSYDTGLFFVTGAQTDTTVGTSITWDGKKFYSAGKTNSSTNAVTYAKSTWSHGKTGAGASATTDGQIFAQKFTQAGLTYTPSGGSATTLNDSGDLIMWLSQSSTANQLYLNMIIDGNIYAGQNMYASTFNGTVTYASTTADTTNALYPIGVTSGATTTLKRDTSITFTGANIKTAGTLEFNNTSAVASIQFDRTGNPSYISIPDGEELIINNTTTLGRNNAILNINKTAVFSYLQANLGVLATPWNEIYGKTLYINATGTSNAGGISLYSTSSAVTSPTSYGIAMRSGAAHGWISAAKSASLVVPTAYANGLDWNIGFYDSGSVGRGWRFVHGGTSVASISGKGYATFNRISLNRRADSTGGRIYWYDTDVYSTPWTTWVTYMDNSTNGAAPTGGKPSTLGNITTWAIRSLIEQASGYGWLWESCANGIASANTVTPTARMALSSNTGQLYLNTSNGAGTPGSLQILNSTTLTAGQWTWGINHIASGMIANTNSCLLTGQGSSTLNQTVLNFHYAGSSNVGNYAGLGLYGAEDRIKVFSKYIESKYPWNTMLTATSSAAAAGDATNGYTAARWVFNLGMATPADGDTITIKVPVVSHDYGVYISTDNGTTFKPVGILGSTTRLTGQYGANSILTLTYDSDGQINNMFPTGVGTDTASTSRKNVTGGCWRVVNYYDSGNDGLWYARYYTYKAQTAITAVHVVGGTDSGYNHVDSGTAFDIRYPVLYANGAINAGSTANTGYIFHYAVNIKNSSGNNVSFTSYRPVYIKGTLSGTTFTPITGGNPYVNAITASDDGYVYYYIGRSYSTNAMTFDATGAKMYQYKNGEVRPYGTVQKLQPGAFHDGYAYAAADGVLEVGPYIDLHSSISGVDDYTARIGVDNSAISITGKPTLVDSLTAPNGDLVAGTFVTNTAQSQENHVFCQGGAGALYLYSQAATTAYKGLFCVNSQYNGSNASTTTANVFSINQNNLINEFMGFDGTAAIEKRVNNTSWIRGRDGAIIRRYRTYANETSTAQLQAADERYVAAMSLIGTTYSWDIGMYLSDTLYISCISNSYYNADTPNQCNSQVSIATDGQVNTVHNVRITGAGERYFATTNTNTGCTIYLDSAGSYNGVYSNHYWNGSSTQGSGGWLIYRGTDGNAHCSFPLYNAVWNDYAEYRASNVKEPGRVLTEDTDGIMKLANERLLPACKVYSDTFGTAMGKTKKDNTPIAVSGRVLVYPYRDRKEYHLGDAVCSAPNGTVDIMTREEIMTYPERIIGTVSEIPTYEKWECGDIDNNNPQYVSVKGRIWIYVR